MFDFSKVVDRHGTWCTQWDYVADRFGTADLLPFTISDMDFATAPCIIEALNQRLMHGVFGYSRWKNDEFLAAIAHWFSTQHYTAIDSQTVVYGPSVIYMVSELIRQWSETGEGVVIHTPAYDAFYKAIEGNQRTVMPVALEKQADGWFCDMGKLEAVLAKPECKIMLLCSPQNPTGKCGRAMSWRSWLTCASVMVCGLFPMKSIWIWFGASSRIFPGVMWLAETGRC